MSVTTAPFSYRERGTTPVGYTCGTCEAVGVKLWRDYSMFLHHQSLRCQVCAMGEHKHPSYETNPDGFMARMKTDQLCGRVPAVPTEEGDTYWGYTSVPEEGYHWWDSLPPGRNEHGNYSNLV